MKPIVLCQFVVAALPLSLACKNPTQAQLDTIKTDISDFNERWKGAQNHQMEWQDKGVKFMQAQVKYWYDVGLGEARMKDLALGRTPDGIDITQNVQNFKDAYELDAGKMRTPTTGSMAGDFDMLWDFCVKNNIGGPDFANVKSIVPDTGAINGESFNNPLQPKPLADNFARNKALNEEYLKARTEWQGESQPDAAKVQETIAKRQQDLTDLGNKIDQNLNLPAGTGANYLKTLEANAQNGMDPISELGNADRAYNADPVKYWSDKMNAAKAQPGQVVHPRGLKFKFEGNVLKFGADNLIQGADTSSGKAAASLVGMTVLGYLSSLGIKGLVANVDNLDPSGSDNLTVPDTTTSLAFPSSTDIVATPSLNLPPIIATASS